MSEEDEDRKCFTIDMQPHIRCVIGLDPTTAPEHRQRLFRFWHYIHVGESLFWTVAQLGMVAEHGGWVYQQSDLFEALRYIGEVGRDFLAAAGDEAEHIELIADKLSQDIGRKETEEGGAAQ
jgi:hypothetical protein